MENIIKRAAELIGASENEMNRFPEGVKQKIALVMHNLDLTGSSYLNEAFEMINDIWTKTVVGSVLSEIVSVTGISEEAVSGLPDKVKKQLCYEYCMDHEDTENLHRIIQNSMAVSELDSIAEMLNIPAGRLQALPLDIRTELSGIYSMEYGEESLETSLRNVLSSWM